MFSMAQSMINLFYLLTSRLNHLLLMKTIALIERI